MFIGSARTSCTTFGWSGGPPVGPKEFLFRLLLLIFLLLLLLLLLLLVVVVDHPEGLACCK